mgnify:CR=1 FL=1
MKNKKGAAFSTGTIFAAFLLVVLALFLIFGGASTVIGLTDFLSSIPIWVWGILVVIFIFMRWAK